MSAEARHRRRRTSRERSSERRACRLATAVAFRPSGHPCPSPARPSSTAGEDRGGTPRIRRTTASRTGPRDPRPAHGSHARRPPPRHQRPRARAPPGRSSPRCRRPRCSPSGRHRSRGAVRAPPRDPVARGRDRKRRAARRVRSSTAPRIFMRRTPEPSPAAVATPRAGCGSASDVHLRPRRAAAPVRHRSHRESGGSVCGRHSPKVGRPHSGCRPRA